jgi:L-iditol 2-dehydrogenase
VRPGGLVNLFGGCAPGTTLALDAGRVHYGELTIKGVYHHRPDTVRRALEMLADPAFPADLLLTGEQPIAGVEDALKSMISKQALKVVIRGRGPVQANRGML